MKQIVDRMALLLCTISLVPGLARYPRARGSSGRPPEWGRDHGDHRERGDVPMLL